ncbi:hypothetical protein [Flavobacterium undicola]|uniref:hypothetical protein n=1 Tax=Flavobacterium undicola TaxID=1932779 RepID=UPI0013782B0F|nr:hypothetical protein [Flavobacterium undicola]MBA0883685.1 hypothetical protein [Flavobacterium undicola]
MKKMILTVFATIAFIAVGYCQNDYPNNILNIGVGIGGNYGGIGTKTIIGYRNSGLLVGLGSFGGGLWYEIGGQISYKWMYLNLGYGIIGVSENLLTNDNTELIKGKMATIGAMINLGKSKKYFLDLGIGYDWDGTYTSNSYTNEKDTFNTIDAAIGFGIRL